VPPRIRHRIEREGERGREEERRSATAHLPPLLVHPSATIWRGEEAGDEEERRRGVRRRWRGKRMALDGGEGERKRIKEMRA
jgi:hypothetical protein